MHLTSTSNKTIHKKNQKETDKKMEKSSHNLDNSKPTLNHEFSLIISNPSKMSVIPSTATMTSTGKTTKRKKLKKDKPSSSPTNLEPICSTAIKLSCRIIKSKEMYFYDLFRGTSLKPSSREAVTKEGGEIPTPIERDCMDISSLSLNTWKIPINSQQEKRKALIKKIPSKS